MEILWKCNQLGNVVPSLAYMQNCQKYIIVYYELNFLFFIFFSIVLLINDACDVWFEAAYGHDTYLSCMVLASGLTLYPSFVLAMGPKENNLLYKKLISYKGETWCCQPN